MFIQKRSLYFYIVIIFGFCLAKSAFAQKVQDGLPSNIRHGILNNGLTYYILKTDASEKKIFISLVNKIGSHNFDDPAQLGLAHFIEHLGFQGTNNFPNGIRKELRSHGLRSGADFGASTDAQSTFYWVDLHSSDDTLFNRCLLVAHDWAAGRLFIPGEVAEERAAVKNEMEGGNNPSFQSWLQEPYLLLGRNPLYEPRQKKESDNIDTTSITRLREFETKWYRPDLQAIIIVGDIDEAMVEKQVRILFSNLAAKDPSAAPPPTLKRYQAKLNGNSEVTILNRSRQGFAISTFQERYSIPKSCYTSQQKKHEKVLNELYNEIVITRLNKSLRKYKLNYSAVAHHILKEAISGLAGIDALVTRIQTPDLKSAKKVFKFVNLELNRIRRWGFSESELIAAKQAVTKSNLGKLKLPGLDNLNNALAEHFISQSPVSYTNVVEFDSLMASVKLAEMNNMAAKWIGEQSEIDIKVELPDQEPVKSVDKEELLNIFKKARTKKISPYVETIPRSPFNGSIPDTASCVVTEIPEIDAVHLKLGNGATVVIKRMGKATPIYELGKGIEIKAFSGRGVHTYQEKDRASAWLSTTSVTSAGLGILDKDELANWMAQKNITGSLNIIPYIEYDEAGIEGEASVDNVEELFKLVYLYFTHPREDKRAFLDIKRNSIPVLNRRNFEDSVRAVINSLLGRTDPQRSVKNAEFRRSVDVYKEIFSNAADFKFVIAGYFELEEIKRLATKYLGALPTGTRKARIIKDTIEVSNQIHPLHTTMVGDSAGNINIRLLFPGTGANNQKDQFELKILSNIIQVKLHERLRTKEKFVYAVQSHMTLNRENGLYVLDVNFETLPTNVEQAISFAVEEISTLAVSGFNDGIFLAAKRSVEVEVKGNLQSQSYWITNIAAKLQSGELLQNFLEDDAVVISNITKADILRAAERFLNVKQYHVFKLR